MPNRPWTREEHHRYWMRRPRAEIIKLYKAQRGGHKTHKKIIASFPKRTKAEIVEFLYKM